MFIKRFVFFTCFIFLIIFFHLVIPKVWSGTNVNQCLVNWPAACGIPPCAECPTSVPPTSAPTGGGGCAPPPAPWDLQVEWQCSPYQNKVKATWKPGTPGTLRKQRFVVTSLLLTPGYINLACDNNSPMCIYRSDFLDSNVDNILLDKSLFTMGKIYHFYIFNVAGGCSTYDYDDHLFSCQPSPTPVLFRCLDFVTVRINNCDGASFNSNPKAANCYTPNSSVTLNMEESLAQVMGFINRAPGTDCDSIPSNSYLGVGRSFPYARSRSWTLEPGDGEKQVCTALYYDPDPDDISPGTFKKCEARIMVGAAPTPPPSPWIKLKNTSFISKNNLTSNIPLVPVVYDSDDDGTANFVISAAGVVAAPAINITGLNSNAKTGSPEYKAIYSPNPYSLTPSSFLSYIKARKQHKVITSLGQITADGIYIWDGIYPLPINDTNKVRFDNYKVVFIATGQVNINTDTGLNPANGSLAIIAPTIAFHNIVEEANGIFIANDITTGSPSNQGLKIIGNLIALESLTNDREWTNGNKPSLFIVFDQEKYIHLLPYLSTANYDWRQIQ